MSALRRDVDGALAAVVAVPGWLTNAQARRLHAAAGRVPAGGRLVEIGSFRGRSAIVLALGSPPSARLWAIDPHAGTDRGPREIVVDPRLGEDDHAAFLAHLEAAGMQDEVAYVRKLSHEAHGDVPGVLDLLYVDGAHRFSAARLDVSEWGARVAPGGTLLIHDAFSSVGVTGAIATELLTSPEFLYVGRSGSLVEYRREQLDRGARRRNVARQLAQLPWFVRNLAIKALIVLHLRPVAGLLGHRDGPWPY